MEEVTPMATLHCTTVAEHYLNTLRQQYEVQQDGEDCLLLTPLYLPDNTQLGVHLTERADGSFEITDYGETFDYLFLSGLNISPEDKRLERIGKRFEVAIEQGEIRKTAAPDDLDRSINSVIQAILDTAYLVYTRRPRAVPNFAADVEQLLIHIHRAYEKQYEVAGRTATHTFDYRFSRRNEPVLMETLSTTNRHASLERAQVTSFKVLDSRSGEGREFTYVCLLDDRTPDHEDVLTERALAPLRGYLDHVVRWSERGRLVELLAA
jgi:hypothetical protein